MSDKVRGNVMLLLTAMIWGGGFVAQSAGMDYIGPFTFCAARYVLAMLALIPVIFFFSVQARKIRRPAWGKSLHRTELPFGVAYIAA